MSDTVFADRKVEALGRLNQAEQSAKNAEVAFQEACSQYNRVMSIKAGTKGGGKGAKREVANIKAQAAEVLAEAQAELEVAMLIISALTTPPPEVQNSAKDVDMSEGSSIKFADLDREVDSVEGDKGNREGIDDVKVNEEGDGEVSQNGKQDGEVNLNGEHGDADSLNGERSDEDSLNGEQGNTAVEGKGKEKLGIQDKYPDDPSWPSDTDEEKEDAKYLAVRKDKKDLELSTEDLKLFRFLPKEEQETQTKTGMEAIHAFLKEGTAIPDKITRMARVDPTYLPKAAMTSRALALHFITSGKGNIQCGYHSYRNKSCYNRDGWGKPGAKIHGVPGKRRVTNSRGKAGEKASGKSTVPPSMLDFAHCGCRIDDCLLEFFLSKLLVISGRVEGKRVKENMFGCYDYQPPRARSFMHEAFWSFTGPLTLDHIYDEEMDEARYLCSLNEYMAREYINLWNSSLKDIHGKEAQGYTLLATERLRQLEEFEKIATEAMNID